MVLTLDIGNSAVKGGLFDGVDLADVFTVSLPLVHDGEVPDAAAWTEKLRPYLDATTVEQVGLVSVVPGATAAVAEAVSCLTTAPVTHVGPSCPLPFDLAYETPETLGADRLAAAAAGWVRYGRTEPRSVLVVDAGTAVTVELVRRSGIYVGGTIGAGPVLTQRSLRAGTAQLPEVPLSLPEDPIGRSTQAALQSGIMWGLVDQVRGMTARLAALCPDAPALVLTGGWGALLTEHLDRPHHHVPHLVLRGARLLAKPRQ